MGTRFDRFEDIHVSTRPSDELPREGKIVRENAIAKKNQLYVQRWISCDNVGKAEGLPRAGIEPAT
jgi:hypothetical protein